jgi:Multiubiquitin
MNTPESSSGGENEALKAFEEKQARELAEFEARQRKALEEFERKEQEALKEFEAREHRPYEIKIDRTEYKVHEHKLTGLQLRQLPHPPIGPDRDLFEVVPGGADRKIANDETVIMRDGLRFFTAPAQINPGLL